MSSNINLFGMSFEYILPTREEIIQKMKEHIQKMLGIHRGTLGDGIHENKTVKEYIQQENFQRDWRIPILLG